MEELFCVVDVETTGANRKGQKITEIAIIKTDGKKIIDQYSSLINPEKKIPFKISYLTGITNEMVIGAPKFYQVAKKIVELTDGCTFVAHNVFFDYQFIQREFSEIGYTFRRKLFCTVKNARHAFPGLKSYSLKNLSLYFSICLENHHRALSDTKAAYELFKLIIQTKSNLITQNSPTPKNFDDQILGDLPESGGVYYLFNQADELLYIGKSKNIKNRIKSHFRLNIRRKKDLELKNQISKVTFDLYPHDLISQIVESMEIIKQRPPFNIALRRSRYRYEVILKKDESGFFGLVNQTSRREGIPSKSRRHGERIMAIILEKAFGRDANIELLKRTVGVELFNAQVDKVYQQSFYPKQNFMHKIIELDTEIFFSIEDGRLVKITYGDKIINIIENPDIKKMFLSHLRRSKI